MPVKLLLIAAVLIVAFFLMRPQGGDRQLALRRITMSLFVVAAVATIIFPSIASDLAQLVGVGRGADLLLYMLVVAFLSYAANSYRRLTRQENRITMLARKIAILEAELEEERNENGHGHRGQRR